MRQCRFSLFGLQKMPEPEISDFAKIQLTLPDKIDPADEMSWQHYLYSKLGSKKEVVVEVKDKEKQVEELVERIVAMAKVLYGLHMVSDSFYFPSLLFFPRTNFILFYFFSFIFGLFYFFFFFFIKFKRFRSIIRNSKGKQFIGRLFLLKGNVPSSRVSVKLPFTPCQGTIFFFFMCFFCYLIA